MRAAFGLRDRPRFTSRHHGPERNRNAIVGVRPGDRPPRLWPPRFRFPSRRPFPPSATSQCYCPNRRRRQRRKHGLPGRAPTTREHSPSRRQRPLSPSSPPATRSASGHRTATGCARRGGDPSRMTGSGVNHHDSAMASTSDLPSECTCDLTKRSA